MRTIKLITGAMGSGKSAMLIAESYKYKNPVFIKAAGDNRDGAFIKSRNGTCIKADFIARNFDDILKYIKSLKKKNITIIIDELQFMQTNGLKELVIYTGAKNISVIASGLNLTSELGTFKTFAEFACYANRVIYIKGLCQKCGKEKSVYSECLVDKTEDVLVGDTEYIGVCEQCHKKVKNFI